MGAGPHCKSQHNYYTCNSVSLSHQNLPGHHTHLRFVTLTLPSLAEAAVPVSSVIVVKVRYVSEDNSGGKRYSSLHRFPWYWLKRQAPSHFKSTQSNLILIVDTKIRLLFPTVDNKAWVAIFAGDNKDV